MTPAEISDEKENEAVKSFIKQVSPNAPYCWIGIIGKLG
jgi:hypothetical protein